MTANKTPPLLCDGIHTFIMRGGWSIHHVIEFATLAPGQRVAPLYFDQTEDALVVKLRIGE